MKHIKPSCELKSELDAKEAQENPATCRVLPSSFGILRLRGWSLTYWIVRISARILVLEFDSKLSAVTCASWETSYATSGRVCDNQASFIRAEANNEKSRLRGNFFIMLQYARWSTEKVCFSFENRNPAKEHGNLSSSVISNTSLVLAASLRNSCVPALNK